MIELTPMKVVIFLIVGGIIYFGRQNLFHDGGGKGDKKGGSGGGE